MANTHLTDDQRCDTYEFHVKGFGVREIAKRTNRDKETISRERRRNLGDRGYRPEQTHAIALERHHIRRGGKKVREATWQAARALATEK